MIKIEEIEYKGLSNCLKISNGMCGLVIPTKIGIRILSYSLIGGINVLKNFDEEIIAPDKNNWQLFGGHRLWIAPENMEKTYELDGKPLKSFSAEGNKIYLKQKTDSVSLISKELTVILSENTSEATLIHKITNESDAVQEVSAWAVTSLIEGGIATANFSNNALSPTPDRKLVFWPFTETSDKRLSLDKQIKVVHTSCKKPFKIGSFIKDGYASYSVQNIVFTKYFCAKEGNYPDMNSNFECYANEDFLELESLSLIRKLKKGDSIIHKEIWNLK